MKLKKSLIAFAGCAALLGSTLAYAQPAAGPADNNGRNMMPHVAKHGPGSAQATGPAALAIKLGLSPEQTQQIQQIQEDSAQAVQAIVMDENLMEKRKELAEVVLDADASNRDIKKKVEKVNDIQKKISFEMAKSRHDAFLALSTEQQEQFKTLLTEKVQDVKGQMMAAQDSSEAAPVPAPQDDPQGDVLPAPADQ